MVMSGRETSRSRPTLIRGSIFSGGKPTSCGHSSRAKFAFTVHPNCCWPSVAAFRRREAAEKWNDCERRTAMQYLVHMRLASAGRPTTPEDGLALIEHVASPTPGVSQ